MSTATYYRDRVDRLLARREHLARTVADEREAIDSARATLAAAKEAQRVAQAIAQEVQQSAHSQIAAVVSRCLAAVFDEPYELRIEFQQKRGRTEARLLFARDGREVEPTEASGGGPLDVAAFALRLAALVLTRPRRRRFLALDEPFRCLDAARQPRVRALLETLARDLGVQIVLVTHAAALAAGKVVRVE